MEKGRGLTLAEREGGGPVLKKKRAGSYSEKKEEVGLVSGEKWLRGRRGLA